MRTLTPLFSLACIGLISLVGCGGAGIGTLRGGEVSDFAGSYGGTYTGTHGEAGMLNLSVARDASFLGTITIGFSPTIVKQGVVTGIVAKNGHFNASFHYTNETIVYSGSGIMTEPVTTAATSTTANGVTTQVPAMRGFDGIWNLTTPTVTTLSFEVSGVAGTATTTTQ